MKHKKLFISLTAVCSVIIFLGIFLLSWFCFDTYKDFESFSPDFDIAGLDDGAVPQGITSCAAKYTVYDEEGGALDKTQFYYFVSAYMTDKSASRIYVTAEDTGYVGYVTLKNIDGSDFKGHCGGIAINNTTSSVTASSSLQYSLWVTGESKVYVAKCSEAYSNAKKTIAQEIIEKAALNISDDKEEDADCSITFTSQFNANCNASFCFYYDDPRYTSMTYDRLYIGEFYRKGNYETDKSHWLVTPNGYQNTAFMYEYNVNSASEYGLVTLTDSNLDAENTVPAIQKIFSLPELVQGIAFSGKTGYSLNNGTLVLSQSYGLANSHLLCFDYATIYTTKTTYTSVSKDGISFYYDGVTKTVGGQTIAYTANPDLYFVDKANADMLTNDYSIPSMSEGMCVNTPYVAMSTDDIAINTDLKKIHVLFESGCKKYKTFVRQQTKSVYHFTPSAR